MFFSFPVNLSIITYGLQLGWISPVVKLLQSDQSPTGRPLTNSEIAWIASLPSLVSAFCASPYSWVVDRYGRRFGIATIGVAQAVSLFMYDLKLMDAERTSKNERDLRGIPE